MNVRPQARLLVIYEFAGQSEHMMHSLVENLSARMPGLRITFVSGLFRTYRPGGFRPGRLANAAWVYFFSVLHLLFRRPAAVLVHSAPPGIQLWTVAWASLRRIPVVCWLMDYHPELEARLLDSRGHGSAARVLRALDARLMPRFDMIVTLDPAMTALVRLRAAAIEVLEHPTWGHRGAVQAPVSYQPGAGTGPLRLAYSGNLGAAHDLIPLRRLIEATVRRHPVQLFVFGASAVGERRFRELGEYLGISVETGPRVPFSDLRSLYEDRRIGRGHRPARRGVRGSRIAEQVFQAISISASLSSTWVPRGTNTATVCARFQGGILGACRGGPIRDRGGRFETPGRRANEHGREGCPCGRLLLWRVRRRDTSGGPRAPPRALVSMSLIREAPVWIRPMIAGMAVALAFGGMASESDADTSVYNAEKNLLSIYVAAGCAAEDREAAEEMARVLGEMSGRSWSVEIERPDNPPGLYVGGTRASARRLPAMRTASDPIAPRPGEAGPDAFRVLSTGGSLYLVGATPEASYFAVAWFLESEAGVRWFAPGREGESIPRPVAWAVRDLDVLREPAYFSRELSGFDGPEGDAWKRHNGLRSHLEFSHALNRVFPRELFEEHPAWFPVLGRKRHKPASSADGDWQPNLALPQVSDHAALAALEAFSREPERLSYSLGMNDTVRFDQGAQTQGLVRPLRFFRGMPDYSPLLFGFMNRAAAKVSLQAPDRYLGCLAYFWCENAPPFKVEANVVPYVTTDRTQYYDPAFQAGDLALMARWRESGVRAFGLWEYAFGQGFVDSPPADGCACRRGPGGMGEGRSRILRRSGPHPRV